MSTQKKLEELADEWARQRNWITSGRVCGDLFEESAMGFEAGYAAGQQAERERIWKAIVGDVAILTSVTFSGPGVRELIFPKEPSK